MSIDRYVMTLRAQLSASPAGAAELVEEVRAHLEDAAHDLQMAGVALLESEREAVRRCGPPEEIAQAHRCERRRAGRPVVAMLVAMAVLIVAFGGSAAASAHPAPRSIVSHHPVVARFSQPAVMPRVGQRGGYAR